jgi:hypothetical protein
LGVSLAVALTALALLLRYRGEIPEMLPELPDLPSLGSTVPQTPAATVSALIDAARKEDAAAYLRLTNGELRQSLERTRSELGADRFRAHMRDFAAGIKGVAIPGGELPDADPVVLDVEFVFADRNERQRVTFARRGRGWVITSMERAQMIRPPIPYGTPVFEEPLPEKGNRDEEGMGES